MRTLSINTKQLAGTLWLLISAVSFSFIGLLARLIKDDLSTWEICLVRAIMGVLFMLGLRHFFKVSINGPNRTLLLIRGFSGALCFLTIVAAMQALPISMAMVLFYLFPVFAALLSPWINNEPVNLIQWGCILISFGGVAILLWPQGTPFQLNQGHVLAVAAAFFAGCNINLVRRLSCNHNPFCIYFYACLVALVVSFGPALQRNGLHIPPGFAIGIVVLLGILGTTGQVALNFGFIHLKAHEGGLVLMSQVPISAILGHIFFKEPMGTEFIFGALLILLSAWGLSAKKKPQTAHAAGRGKPQ